MDTFVKFLQSLNGTLGAINTIASPAGALMAILATIRAFRDERAAEGEDTTTLDVEIVKLDALIEALKKDNAAYWEIPVKPTDPVVSDPDQ